MGSSKKILKYSLKALPILIGASGGFLYYNFIGCNGSCAITGNPWTSSFYGAIIGAFFISKNRVRKTDD
jgi:hypothetical protein